MGFKEFYKNSLVAFVIKRILLAIIIFIGLAWITLFILDEYTNLGESVEVPNLQGLYIEEAQSKLRQFNLYAEVIDSVYFSEKPLGTIVEQIPAALSHVKRNRAIFLIMNKQQLRTIPLPELNDVSVRQAEALLKSLGLGVSSVEYRPSEFKDLVIDVLYQGNRISAGTRLVEGSSVQLIVGSGIGEGVSTVPSLLGLSLNDARSNALSMSFILGSVNVTENSESATLYVYRQSPSPGSKMPFGSRINVWLTSDQDKMKNSLKEQSASEQEEVFF